MLSGSRQLTTAVMVGEAEADAAMLRILPAQGRPLIPAPGRGPLAEESQRTIQNVAQSLGGHTFALGEQGRGAPMLPPSPAPSPVARGYFPAVWRNPGHWLFPLQRGGRDASVALASIPQGEQSSVPLRSDWRRPNTIQHDAVSPRGG